MDDKRSNAERTVADEVLAEREAKLKRRSAKHYRKLREAKTELNLQREYIRIRRARLQEQPRLIEARSQQLDSIREGRTPNRERRRKYRDLRRANI